MQRMIKIKDAFVFLKKSKIKAGNGLEVGKYPFYTSSSVLSKYLDSYEIEEESLIFGTGGSASVHHSNGEFSSSTDCFVVQSNNKYEINLRYVYLFFSGNIHILENGFKGAGLKHISKKYLEDVEIPLPSLETQKKIVEVLDKAQGLIDARKVQIRLMDELIQSVFYEMFGDPVTNPKGWDKKPLGKIFEILTGSTPSRKNKDYWINSNIPWVKTSEVNFYDIYETDEKISRVAVEETNVKILPVDTLLIAMYGQGKTRGRVGRLKIDAATNQACAAILPIKQMNMEFVYQYLKQMYNELRALGRGGNQPNLNLGLVKAFEIIIPDTTTQNKFEIEVERINLIKSNLENSLNELEEIYLSIMTKAFKGEFY